MSKSVNRELYEGFLASLDAGALRDDVVALNKLDLPQTFEAYHKSMQYVRDKLLQAGIPNVELLEFPADGKTVYQDKRMPLAWDASVGRLTMLPPGASRDSITENDVLADYSKNPFNLVKGSVSTPPEGIVTRIITEQQYLAGDNPKDALIMLEPFTWPRRNVLTPLLRQGGLGVISDFLSGRYMTPDATQWVNAGTEAGDWHVTAEDLPFISFSVSPKQGDMIRRKANAGGLRVLVECDGRRHEGKLPMVTAMIPGRQKKEIWILAHAFEPLLDDDANGIVASIEIAKRIMEKGTPEYSVRLVFAMEMYGYAAYAAYRGNCLKGQVLGACNLDSLGAMPGKLRCVRPGGNATYIGSKLLEEVTSEFQEELDLELGPTAYFDDMFLSDASVGLPTTWILGGTAGYWHNSAQCEPELFDWEIFRKNVAFACTYLYRLANYTGPEPEAPALEVKEKHSKWRDYAAKIIAERAEIGFPHSLAKVQRDDRISLPDGIIYGHMANVLSNMDGHKNLARLIAEAEAERNTELTEAQVKKYVSCINFLADHGYLSIKSRPEITQDMICEALRNLGISREDTLLVHASSSNCGYIRGGARTIIDAIRENAGTALFTTFTRPYIYLGGLNRGWNYMPYDAQDWKAVWTGNVGKSVLHFYPEAVRSRHITHSWAGFGKNAHFCLDAHGACDAPAGKTSPMHQALQLGGKVLFFGSGLAPNTFLHYLEDCADMPFLDDAVCRMKNEDGSLKTVIVPRHLPGHRDFYRKDAENCKFYQRAFARGLEVKSAQLGLAQLQLIDLRQMYEIGMQLLKEDRRTLLCDDKDCLFCRRFQ